MRIVLEGPDNAGKTTLAHELVRAGANYHHPGGPPSSLQAEFDCMDQQQDLFKLDDHLCMDRCTAISQQVYSPDEKQERFRREYLERLFQMGVTFVYCRPTLDHLLRSDKFTWREGESEEHKKKIIDNAHTFVDRYDKVMSSIRCVHYDFTAADDASLVRAYLVRAIKGGEDSPAFEFINRLMRKS